MLLLVAVNDKGHVSPWNGGSFLNIGLTGALLAELAMGGQLAIAADGTVRAGDTRPDDELLADVHDAVREHLDGRKTRQVIRGLSRHIGGSRDRIVDRLVDSGILGREKPSILQPTRHSVIDTATHQAVLDQVRAAAGGDGPMPPISPWSWRSPGRVACWSGSRQIAAPAARPRSGSPVPSPKRRSRPLSPRS